jgi:TRAP-type C4-dicarboxylate transport system substrate-binding protein
MNTRLLMTAIAAGVLAATTVGAQPYTMSIQYPASGDYRTDAANLFAQEVVKAGVDVKVHPDQSLVVAGGQLPALKSGTIDFVLGPVSALAQDFAPEFGILAMPGLVTNVDQMARLTATDSAFFRALNDVAAKRGILFLGLQGSVQHLVNFGSADCFVGPASLKGKSFAASSAAMPLVKANGGKFVYPGSISVALERGGIDSSMSSTADIVGANLQTKAKCILMGSGENFVGAVFSGIMVSKQTWDRLTPAQKDVVNAAATKAIAHVSDHALRQEVDGIIRLRQAGAKMPYLNVDQASAWRQASEKTVFAEFRKVSPDASRLLDAAISAR